MTSGTFPAVTRIVNGGADFVVRIWVKILGHCQGRLHGARMASDWGYNCKETLPVMWRNFPDNPRDGTFE